jgi:hypothetical protein
VLIFLCTMRKSRVIAPSYEVGKIRGIAYGMHGILLVETVIIYKCVMNSVTCT